MITEAVTDEEVLGVVNKKWLEEWFESTTVHVGNPWNSTGEEDFAILVVDGEETMDTGIGRLLRDRFPEVGKIEGTGSLRVTSTVQIGTEEPTSRNRAIHKVKLCGTTDAEVLAALKKLDGLVQGSKVVAVPVPTGVEEGKIRKLAELVFRKGSVKVAIHIPQSKGGKGRTPPLQARSNREKPRRDANTEILLVKQTGKSYGEMVRGLRTVVGNKKDVKSLKQVRRTQDGRLLLAFNKGESEIEEIKSLIKEAWEGAEVSGGGKGDARKCVVHLKGLDVTVEDEEIRQALHEAIPSLQKEEIEIGDRRPMFGENLAVTIRMPNRFAEDLRKTKRVKIGFNTCRLEERVDIMKCFRCWEFGHIARQCKGPDRRSLCSGCGQEGHVAVDCRNAPHCVLCEVDGHRGGSGSCPRFREALQARKRTAREKPPSLSQNQGESIPPIVT